MPEWGENRDELLATHPLPPDVHDVEVERQRRLAHDGQPADSPGYLLDSKRAVFDAYQADRLDWMEAAILCLLKEGRK